MAFGYRHAPQSAEHSWHPSVMPGESATHIATIPDTSISRKATSTTRPSGCGCSFAWMMKNSDDGIPDRAKAYKIDFRTELEPNLEFDKLWVQERRNQLAMLDTFFGAITPEESLVFFYAKRAPLTETGGGSSSA